ncbi:MAG: dicarboxylate/amino acid:cation symporter [Clostridia bacterium]|nr:dicarboxylate/amino acid:cation symporter [Clostridia bacterium]
MKILKNYLQTILLIVAVIIGGAFGTLFPEQVMVVKPLGTLFINLIFMIIVPLIFFSISSSIGKMKHPKRLGRIMKWALIIFAITSVVSVTIGLISTYIYKPLSNEDMKLITNEMALEDGGETSELNGIEQFVASITVDDFSKLLSKNSILPLIVFSVLFGIAAVLVGEKAEPMVKFLEAGNEIVMKMITIIMYYAPIGLGCYFATTIADLGASLVAGYVRAFIGYTILSILYYFIIYTIQAWIAGGKKAVKDYWKNIVPPSLTALGTCSSGVSIPSNIIAAKKIGVTDDIAEMVIPFGTNIHKEGSLIGSVLKIVFLFCLFGRDMTSIPMILAILGASILVGFLISAVPTGGGVISEMLILSLFGFPTAAIGILAIIATIIDAPATVLNVVGNTSSSMLVARCVEGKNWNKNA